MDLLSNPWLFAAVTGAAGAIMAVVLQRILNKRGLVSYSVAHNRVGMSADDAHFGSVKVTWNDSPIMNLFLSTIELRNESLRDFEDVQVRVWSTTTSLLTERADLLGTTHTLSWTTDFSAILHIPHGQQATPAQSALYYGERNYAVPTLNRGQAIRFTYLNAAKGPDVPNIWVDVVHPGMRVAYRVVPQHIFGVPQPVATLIGITLGVILLPIAVQTLHSPWLLAILAFVYGVTVVLPGVLLLKVWRWLRDVIGG